MYSLEFQRSHASITHFPPSLEIPDFVLVTGPNGAGKTHLLQAISNGAITARFSPGHALNVETQVRMFDWASILPQELGVCTSDQIRVERFNLWNNVRSQTRGNSAYIENLRRHARQFELPEKFIVDPCQLRTLSEDEIAKFVNPERVSEFLIAAVPAYKGFENIIIHQLDGSSQEMLRKLAELKGCGIWALTEEDVMDLSFASWGQSYLFQQSFSRLFVEYRDLRLKNQLAQWKKLKSETTAALTDEEFERQFGPPPWDFVNNALMDANLDFQINAPVDEWGVPFQAAIRKISNGVEIPFTALSSGEKILISFAFCVYYGADRRQIINHPALLLLDEVDAPLHPSMSKNILNTIQKTLVGAFGIKVIATTHSPTTVALAPEESIYTMRPGEMNLFKSSKAEALNILTVGVPTLAISYDGRRQVFVESPIDADVYTSIYELVKPSLATERSLEFIATGSGRANGEHVNTGCAVLKELVGKLAGAGNNSIFGLVDWDNGGNGSSGRIAVLADGRRDGLENVLLDPLLVAMTIMRGFPKSRPVIGIDPMASYIEVAQYGTDKLQTISDAVTIQIFGSSPAERIESRYLGGITLQVDARCGSMDDHAYEAAVLKAFPVFGSIVRGQGGGKLLQHVASHVLADNPKLIPMDLVDTMRDLLSRPAHQ